MERNFWDKLLSSVPIDNKAAFVSDFSKNFDVDEEEDQNIPLSQLNDLLSKRLSLADFKKATWLLKNLRGIKLCRCLEIIARQQGFKNYMECRRAIK